MKERFPYSLQTNEEQHSCKGKSPTAHPELPSTSHLPYWKPKIFDTRQNFERLSIQNFHYRT